MSGGRLHRLKDRLEIYVAPFVGAVIGLVVSITTVPATDEPSWWVGPMHLATALFGLIIGMGLNASVALVLFIRRFRDGYILVPCKDQLDPELVSVCEPFSQVLDATDHMTSSEHQRQFVARVLRHQLLLQAKKARGKGQIQLISESPGDQVLGEGAAALSKDAASDLYQLIATEARQGDEVIATAFTNSRRWWLKSGIARNFFKFNLNLLSKGVEVRRVFGLNRAEWNEDEEGYGAVPSAGAAGEGHLENGAQAPPSAGGAGEVGSKVQLLDLAARLEHSEVFTIDYADLGHDLSDRLTATEVDCLVYLRDGQPIIGIEWSIDREGAAVEVHAVFGEGRLEELVANFRLIARSHRRRGRSGTAIDAKTSEGRREALDAFEDVLAAAGRRASRVRNGFSAVSATPLGA